MKTVNEQAAESIDNATAKYSKMGLNIVNAAQRISSATMGISALKGAWDALNNEDVIIDTFWAMRSLSMFEN